jgi:hypothetical protein
MFLCRLGQSILVDIAQSDDVLTTDSAGIRRPAPSGADHPDVQFLVGGRFGSQRSPRRESNGGSQQQRVSEHFSSSGFETHRDDSLDQDWAKHRGTEETEGRHNA